MARAYPWGQDEGYSPATFKNVFDVPIGYTVSVILNLFDSNKPYALSTQNRKDRKCAKKCIVFGETLRIRVKKFKGNLPENYSKSTKIAITACKFS